MAAALIVPLSGVLVGTLVTHSNAVATASASGATLARHSADPGWSPVLPSNFREAEMEEVFHQALLRHPCSAEAPWSLVVVFDEFTPGNVLKPHNERKTMVVNFTFLELQPAVSDNLWFTMAVARATVILATVLLLLGSIFSLRIRYHATVLAV